MLQMSLHYDSGVACRLCEQLTEEDKLDVEIVHKALFKAYKVDALAAYNQLLLRLHARVPVDIYIADIRPFSQLS